MPTPSRQIASVRLSGDQGLRPHLLHRKPTQGNLERENRTCYRARHNRALPVSAVPLMVWRRVKSRKAVFSDSRSARGYEPVKMRGQLGWIKAKGPRPGFECHTALAVDQIDSIRPSG